MQKFNRIVVTCLFIVSVLVGFFPSTLQVSSADSSSNLNAPNPGSVNLTKTVEPNGRAGGWKITLTVEGTDGVDASGNVTPAARNMVVTEPIGDKYTYVDYDHIPTPQGTIRPNYTNYIANSITWNIGDISGNTPVTMTYEVRASSDSSKYPDPEMDDPYMNNEPTHLDYEDISNKVVSKDIDGPIAKYKLKVLYKFEDQVLDSRTEDKAANESIAIQSKTFAGFQLKNITMRSRSGETTVQDHDTVSMPDQKLTITYIYEAIPKQSITVKYLEQNTNVELHQEKSVSGTVGESTMLTAEKIADYEAVVETQPYTFDSNSAKEVIFYYTAVKKQTLEVKYLEQGTDKKLAPPAYVNDVTNHTVRLDMKTIPGYHVVFGSPKTYTFNSALSQYATIYYIADKHMVTVKYLEKGTNQKLAAEMTQVGALGDQLKLKAITIPGYLAETEQMEYIIGNEGNQEVIFYYSQSQIKDRVVVKYLEKGTNKVLTPDVIKTGNPGGKIELVAQNIPGYRALETSKSYSFKANATHEVVFYYTATPSSKGRTVIVNYVDRSTNQAIQQPITYQGKVGTTLHLTDTPITVSNVVYTPEVNAADYPVTDLHLQSFTFYYKKSSSTNMSTITTTKPSVTDQKDTTIVKNVIGLSEAINIDDTKVPTGTILLPQLEKDEYYNYIKGYPDGEVEPNHNISREEVAAIFYRLMTDESRNHFMKQVTSYHDITKTRWSSRHIATMENAGIVTGYPQGLFKPGQSITRAEFAVIASRFDQLDSTKNGKFSDIEGHWAEKYIVSAANKGWIKGYEDGTFKPDQYITRAEAMAFINSELDRKVTVDEAKLKDKKEWPDNSVTKWYYTEIVEATNYHTYTRNADGTETWIEVKPDHVYPE